MAYALVCSDRLEDLIEHHLDRFRSRFFEQSPWIVLQNQSLAQWLKLHLTTALGAYATGDFLFPDMAVRKLLDSDRVLFMDNLKTVLFLRLNEILKKRSRNDAFEPLRRYCGSPPDGRKVFELADHTAGLFHSYAMNSDELLTCFMTGTPPSFLPDAATENWEWQQALWKAVFDGKNSDHAGILLERGEKNPPVSLRFDERPHLILVGSAFLSRRAGSFLRSWAEAELIDVLHLLIVPSTGILEFAQARPWASWGRFGRAFLQDFPVPKVLDPPQPLRAGLLSHLQSALRDGRVPHDSPPQDETFQIVSCVHPLRELEVLKDRLLSILESNRLLKIHEIAVLAPDMNVYAPFIETVFSSDTPLLNLDSNVIDLSMQRETPYFRGLADLMTVMSGSLDRPSVFSLLRNPRCQSALGITEKEVDEWLTFTDQAAVFREDAHDFRPSPPTSWERAWERLFDGVIWGDSDAITWSGLSIHPIERSESGLKSLGLYFHSIRTLKAFILRVSSGDQGFHEWIKLLADAQNFFLQTLDGESGWEALSSRLFSLNNDLQETDQIQKISWEGFQAFVRDQISHFSGRRGQLLLEGVHFSSLKPLRALPFKVIAVLGLGEEQFPLPEKPLSFDLRVWEEGQEDLSGPSLDRYTFWETIMSAREHLLLFYPGRDGRSGERKAPSSVLSDLFDWMRAGGIEPKIDEEPIHAFSDKATQEGTFSPRTMRQVQALRSGTGKEVQSVESARYVALDSHRLEEEFPIVRYEDILQALRTPALHHLRRLHGIVLWNEDQRAENDREPWEIDRFTSEPFFQQCWWDLAEGKWHSGSTRDRLDDFLNYYLSTGSVQGGAFLDSQKLQMLSRLETMEKTFLERTADSGIAKIFSGNFMEWSGRPFSAEIRYLALKEERVLPFFSSQSGRLKAVHQVAAAIPGLLLQSTETVESRLILETISADGESVRSLWNLDPEKTATMKKSAERYWRLILERPLPFYPDYLDQVKALRADQPDASWGSLAEQAWQETLSAPSFVSDTRTLKDCPYAALAFSEPPNFDEIGECLADFWAPLFLPLLQAWTPSGGEEE